MANNTRNITFGVNFNVDSSSLQKIRQSFDEIYNAGAKGIVNAKSAKEARETLTSVENTAEQVYQALTKAYNAKLNTVNISKFNEALSSSNLSIDKVYQSFMQAGTAGQRAFTSLSAEILTTNTALKTSQSLLDKMGTTLVNTIKWNVASTAINSFTSSIQSAWNYVKVLDSSLTDIRIVTGDSREEMDRFARSANEAAAALGRQTKDYTNAALTYYQQGLSDDEVQARTTATLKAANITDTDVADMADDLTAVWNGFQIQADQTESAVSKLAAVADTSASDMSELATAMSKSASVANNMGVTIDQLAAQIATITQVTRQAPETTGNALKTIFARINDIKAGTDDAEISLGNYTGKMADLGINVLDANGNLRDTGDVITEIGEKWNTMSNEQQVYLAQTMAGQRQMNNLIALFDNWDTYTKELNTSLNATNELDVKNERYLESLTAHLNRLKAASEGFTQSLANGDSFKSIIDFGTEALKIFTSLSDSIGGGGNMLLSFGSILTNVFSKQIATEINAVVTNIQSVFNDSKKFESFKSQIEAFGALNGLDKNAPGVQAMLDAQREVIDLYPMMNKEQQNTYNSLVQEYGLRTQTASEIEQQITLAEAYGKAVTGSTQALDTESVQYDNLLTKMEQIAVYQKDLADIPSLIGQRNYSNMGGADIQQILPVLQDSITNLAGQFSNIGQVADGALSNLIKNLQSAQTQVQNSGSIANQTTGAIKNNLTAVINYLQQATVAVDNFGENGQELSKLNPILESLKSALGGIRDQAQQAAKIKAGVQIVASIGQIASGISNLINLTSVLSNDTISTGEKVKQVLLNVSMTIPMLVTGIMSVKSALDAAGVSAARLLAFAPYLALIAAAIAGVVAVSVAAYNAWNADAKAAEEAAAQVETLTTRLEECKTAVDELKSSISNYDEAVSALEDLQEGTEEYTAALEEANEQAKALIEKYGLFDNYEIKNGLIVIDQNALEDAQKTLDETASSVAKNLYGAEIVSNQASLKSQATDTSRSIGAAVLETNSGDPYMRNFTNEEIQAASDAIAELTKDQVLSDEQLKESLATLEDLPPAVRENIDTVVDNKDKLLELANATDKAREANEYYAKQILGQEIEDKYGSDINNISGDNTALREQIVAATTERVNQEQAEQNQQIQDEIEEIDTSIASSNDALNKQLKDLGAGYSVDDDKDLALEYAKRVLGYEDTENYTYKGGINKGTVKDETGTAIVDAVSDDVMRHALYQQAKIDEITEKYAQTIDASDFLDTVDKMIEGVDKFGEEYGADFTNALLNALADEDNTNIDFSSLIGDLNRDEIARLSGMDENTLLSALGLTADDIDKLGYDSATEFYDAWQNALGQWDEKTWWDNILEGLRSAKSDIESVISGLQTGDLTAENIGENDEYKDLLTQLDHVKDADSELTSAADILSQTWLIGTQEYQEALEKVQDRLYALDYKDLIDSADEARNAVDNFISESGDSVTIDVESNPEEFQNSMEDLLNAEYQVDVAIHTEAGQEFDSISNAIDDIKTKASLIGEDFIVAAEDVRELNNTFPGILQNMQVLSDGTVQLNSQIVQSAMQSAEAEVQADAQSTIEKLNNQATLLRAKQQSYQNMANAALVLAQSETGTDSEAAAARATISSELANLQEYNSQESSQSQNNNAVEVADSSNTNAQIVSQNWTTAFSNMSQASFQAAQNAIQNMNAVANGGGALADGVSTQYAGSSGVDKETSIINATQDALNNTASGSDTQKVWANLAEQYASMADAAGAAANDIEGMIAQIGASSIDVDKNLGSVSQGKGPSSSNSGKSGSSSKAKEPKSADEVLKDLVEDSDIDKYHEINRALEKMSDNIEDIADAEEKTIRNGLSETIDNQIEALEQQNDLYQKKIDLMKEDLSEQQKKLQALGVEFDKQGNITNYSATAIAYQKQYNALLQQAAKIQDADAQEAVLDQAEALQQYWESLQDKMDNYEKYQDDIQDAQDAIQDNMDKIEEESIKQFKIQIEWTLDVDEAKRDWNKFRKEVIDKIQDDDYLGQARASLADYSTYYNEEGTGSIQALTEHVNATRAELAKIENGDFSGTYGKNEAQALEDLKDYTDQLMENLEDVQEISEEVHDAYLDAIDKANDAFEDQLDLFDQIDGIIEHDMNLIQLLHGEDDYDDLANYYNQRAQNNLKEIDFYRQEIDMWKAQMDNAKEGTEEWEKFRDNWMQAVSDMNSAVEDSVQNLLDKYNNAINKILRDTKNQLLGGDWQAALDEWDKAQWNDDRYLDIASRATGVLDFVDSVNSAMNGQSPKVQKQLAEFLDSEVEDLNSIANLRQIDLDIANKKLEVLQKQIALEDAQNAKTSMRLRRDSQGNYTYQYVADEDQVADAQTELRDSLEELRLLAKNDVSDTIDEVQDKLEEFFEKAQELSETYYDDTETLQQKLLELQESYFGEDGYITKLGVDYNGMQSELISLTGAEFGNLLGEMGTDLQAFLGLNGDDASDQSVWQSILGLIGDDGSIPSLLDAFTTDIYQDNLNKMSEANQDLLFGSATGLNPSWTTALGNMATDYQGMVDNTIVPGMEQIIEVNREYIDDLGELESVADVSFSDISNGIDTTIGETQNLVQDNETLIETYNSEVDAVGAVCDALDNLVSQYGAAESAAISAANAALEYWAAVQGYSADGSGVSAATGNAASLGGNSKSGGSGSNGGNGGGSGSGKSGSGGNGSGSSSIGGKASGSSSSGSKYTWTWYNSGGTKKIYSGNNSNFSYMATQASKEAKNGPVTVTNNRTGQSKSARTAVTSDSASTIRKWTSFASGGYTGEWSDDSGKLAFLHQKELVLNQNDTKNTLSAVKIATGLIDSISGLGSNLLNNLIAGRGISNLITGRNQSTVDQNVTIHAEFPNASSSQEIEKALNNLVNAASQRANGNRRTY